MKNKSLKIFFSFIFVLIALGFMVQIQTIVAEAKTGYFVEVKDKVYFKKYGKDALEQTALWGDYFNYPTGRGGSFVASYDKNTGQVKALFGDDGDRLYYHNKSFYFEHKYGENNNYKSIVYSTDEFGHNTKVLCEYGTISDLSSQGYLVVETFKPGTASSIEVLKDGNLIFHISTDKETESIQYVGIAKDYLLYAVLHYQNYKLIRIDVYGKKLNGVSKALKLGSLNMEDKFADGIDIGNFTVNGKGKVKLSEYKKNEVFQDGNSVYLFNADNNKQLILKDLRKLFKNSVGVTYDVAAADYIDGAVYMIINAQKRDPDADIGWREAYRVLERYYVRIPVSTKKGNMKIFYIDKF